MFLKALRKHYLHVVSRRVLGRTSLHAGSATSHLQKVVQHGNIEPSYVIAELVN